VRRWLDLALRLPNQVVDWLDARVQSKGLNHGFNDSFFADEVFVASDARLRLPPQWQIALLTQAADVMDAMPGSGMVHKQLHCCYCCVFL
jgi:hypothetical protein